MRLYSAKKDISSEKAIVADDMILTADMPTAAGSKMLEGYMSLFDAEVLTRLYEAGYVLGGKAEVGEFGIDVLGETSASGAFLSEGRAINPSAEIVKSGEALAAVCLDVNGSVRRSAAQSGLVSLKPTYGTVSRYGTIPVACSGETVSIMAQTAGICSEILSVVSGHDDKDGTSLSDELCAKVKESTPIRKVALIKNMTDGIDAESEAKLRKFCDILSAKGVEICEIDNSVIAASKAAWNILMCAELCNNVSRYDGVKFGYRSQNFTNLDELYTNSRTEAFGELLKKAILFGSETLSTDNYMKVYDKALRTRRVICEEFAKIFEEFDAVITPVCSSMQYTEEFVTDKYVAFEENFYTAPASVTGLPAVVAGGVQLIGKAFSDSALLELAGIYEKEGK